MARKSSSMASTAWKIIVGVLVALLIIVLAVEIGLRMYLSNQMVNQFKDQAKADGITVEQEPEVSYGKTPLVFGLVQGKLNEMNMKTPSTLQISGEEIKGQPAADIHMEGMTLSENPVAERLEATTDIPDEFMLATIQQGIAQESGMDALGNTVITDINAVASTQTLDVTFAGSLAELSLLPSKVDGGLKFDAAKAEIFGFELPESATSAITESLTQGMNQQVGGGMDIQELTILDGAMRITIVGNDVALSEVTGQLPQGGGAEGGQQAPSEAA